MILPTSGLIAVAALIASAASSPTIPSPTARPHYIEAQQPVVTPSPVENSPTATRNYRRNIISDLSSDASADINSVLSELGSNIPSYVASGVPNFFQDFPTGSAVISSLGLNSSQLAALPTQVLNLGPYANWTNEGWNVHFHGNVYKQPNTSVDDLNKLANGFLGNTSIQSLPQDQQDQARNLTAEIFVVQQPNVTVTMYLEPAPSNGAAAAAGIGENVTLPYPTSEEGDFDVFLPIQNITGANIMAGNATDKIQELNIYATGATNGNATAYLVPPEGFTVVSDIDDILRVTQIYDPQDGILNTFARPFVPWMNMPDIYANWSQSIPNMHFHYLTTTPEQITRNYESFIFANYPPGSFDTRPLNFSDVNATLSIRQALLNQVLETFPQRKFILIADTSNSDVMRDYPLAAHDYPNQIQCIFLRNTSATDPLDRFPYDTSGFKGLNQSQYMFFLTPDDLMHLDITNGNCYNSSVPQNVTFGEQGLPFGINTGSGNGTKSDALPAINVQGQWHILGLAMLVAVWMFMA